MKNEYKTNPFTTNADVSEKLLEVIPQGWTADFHNTAPGCCRVWVNTSGIPEAATGAEYSGGKLLRSSGKPKYSPVLDDVKSAIKARIRQDVEYRRIVVEFFTQECAKK